MSSFWEIPWLPVWGLLYCMYWKNPVTYVFTSLKLKATRHCCQCMIFDIIYRPGRSNTNADLLLWMEPWGGETEWQSIFQASVKSICQRVVFLAPLGICWGMWNWLELLGTLFQKCMLFLHACSWTPWDRCPDRSWSQLKVIIPAIMIGQTIQANKCGKCLWKEKWTSSLCEYLSHRRKDSSACATCWIQSASIEIHTWLLRPFKDRENYWHAQK